MCTWRIRFLKPLEDEKRYPLVFADVFHHDDLSRCSRGGRLGLTTQAPRTSLGRLGATQNLDDDGLAASDVDGFVHEAHPAGADDTLEEEALLEKVSATNDRSIQGRHDARLRKGHTKARDRSAFVRGRVPLRATGTPRNLGPRGAGASAADHDVGGRRPWIDSIRAGLTSRRTRWESAPIVKRSGFGPKVSGLRSLPMLGLPSARSAQRSSSPAASWPSPSRPAPVRRFRRRAPSCWPVHTTSSAAGCRERRPLHHLRRPPDLQRHARRCADRRGEVSRDHRHPERRQAGWRRHPHPPRGLHVGRDRARVLRDAITTVPKDSHGSLATAAHLD